MYGMQQALPNAPQNNLNPTGTGTQELLLFIINNACKITFFSEYGSQCMSLLHCWGDLPNCTQLNKYVCLLQLYASKTEYQHICTFKTTDNQCPTPQSDKLVSHRSEMQCLYSSTLERMPGKTLVSGETFIGAQSIASFSRSPPLKYPCTCPLQFSPNHSLVKIKPTIIRTCQQTNCQELFT